MARLISQDDPGAIDLVAKVLAGGGVVVLPTDTVYGLAALPEHPAAISRIFDIKSRPDGMHLAVLVADETQVSLVSGDMRPGVANVVAAFWPGALTLVLTGATELVRGLGVDDGTIGVRCPDNAFVRTVTTRVGPIAATSANLHGQPTPLLAAEVAAQLPGADLVVDGGPCPAGLASTVVRLGGDGPVELRSGPVALAVVREAWAR